MVGASAPVGKMTTPGTGVKRVRSGASPGGGWTGSEHRATGHEPVRAQDTDRDREAYRTPDAERDTAKAKQKEQGPLSDEALQQRERAR